MDATNNNNEGEISRDDLVKSLVESGMAEADAPPVVEADMPLGDEQAAAPVVAETSAKVEEKPVVKEPAPVDPIAAERANLDAEKARLAAERAAIDAEKAKAKPGHAPEDYDAIAKDFESEGRDDLAKIARNKAAELRHEAEQVKVSAERRDFEQKRLSVIKETCDKEPDLLKPESELYKALEKLLGERKVLLSYPEGFAHAVEAVKHQLAAGRAEALERENGELKVKLGEAERQLQPGIGAPSSESRAVNFDQLPAAEQRARLLVDLRNAE